jgi:hypothetical protein
MGWVVNAPLRALYPQERPGTHCAGGWVVPRADVDGCGKSRTHSTTVNVVCFQHFATNCFTVHSPTIAALQHESVSCSSEQYTVPIRHTANCGSPLWRHPKTLTLSHARCFRRTVPERWAFENKQPRTRGHGVGTMGGKGVPFHFTLKFTCAERRKRVACIQYPPCFFSLKFFF